MRSITTNWNNVAYNSAGTFVDVTSGVSVTIPANTPVNFRSMVDSVESGAYVYAPDALDATPATTTKAAAETQAVTVTVTLNSVGVENAPIKAVSSDVTKATVSPAFANANASGVAIFTITAVASGSATITFTSGAQSDTTVVTVS
jgi:uncharacterized protein YjdB